jgi:thiamine biosynthesis lipoprotein
MSRPFSRRRFITLAAALPAIGLAARSGSAQPLVWTGTAMGAEASMTILHRDGAEAHRLLAACVEEIRRLEGVFSLFRRDSALVRLNRDGKLAPAPAELLELARHARGLSALSDGMFDVTVQPLWTLYHGHFAQAQAAADGPAAALVEQARALVGWRGLTEEDGGLRFARPGMAATFNALAQGYVTDRVAALLRAEGLTDMLLDLGELRGFGAHADGSPWRIGISDPREPRRLMDSVDLRDQAAATSGGYGTVFDAAGRFHHLMNPETGRPSFSWAGVTVFAPTATIADGLSTTLAVAPPERAARLLKDGGGTAAVLIDQSGKIQRLFTAG